MSKIQLTINKTDNDPWILITDESLFTENELVSVVRPYINYITNLNGKQDYSQDIVGNTATFTWTFDTPENADYAKNAMTDLNNTYVSQKKELLKSKFAEILSRYQIKLKIIDL